MNEMPDILRFAVGATAALFLCFGAGYAVLFLVAWTRWLVRVVRSEIKKGGEDDEQV